MLSAMKAASTPIQKLRRRNGRRMNAQLAPTSFMVWIRKRLEYIARRMVLFISAKEINVSITASPRSIRLMFLILSFTASIKSFW